MEINFRPMGGYRVDIVKNIVWEDRLVINLGEKT